MSTTSSTYAGNTLNTRVEREPQQINTGLDKLADYVSAYKPAPKAAQQAAGLMYDYDPRGTQGMGGDYGVARAPRAAQAPPVMVADHSVPGGFGGLQKAMPWAQGAAYSGFDTDQIAAMEPNNAGFQDSGDRNGVAAANAAERAAKAQSDALMAQFREYQRG